MNTKILIIIFLFFYHFQSQSQTVEVGNLFEFYMGDYQKYIRISQRVQEQWGLSKDFLQHTHYNANKDNTIDSVNLVQQVLFIYFRKNSYDYNILELIDDGKHFDNEPDDGIYGNFLVDDFELFKTDEAIIDVTLDTIGISSHILQLPVIYLPEVPKIFSPSHQSTVSSEMPNIYWSIDPNANGCEVILLGDTPILGEELQDILWQKKYNVNEGKLFFEKIPIRLETNKEYTLLIWSYTNIKQISNIWSNGAYSIELSKFKTGASIIQDINLSQNFPNPFNSSTIIKYSLPEKGNVTIKIFDIVGIEVITLINQEQSDGDYYILWNGKDNKGVGVASGVYLYNLIFNDKVITKKMLLTK